MGDSIYIDRRDDGKYRVLREGARLPSALTETRPTAVALARDMRPSAIFIRDARSDAEWRKVRV